MKNFLLVSLLIFSSLVFSQSEIPKVATDISPLLVGEKVPEIGLLSADNSQLLLSKVTSNKKTILVFYRGGWCPYCNQQLSALGESEAKLIEMGYQIIAISPDSPQSMKETISKEKLNYTLLSDSKGDVARAFGIAFKAPENYTPYISKASNGVNTTYIPVPSVFFINEENIIEMEYINPDYKTRISSELLIAIATSLK
jgi:peroxiredoxin